ncbi:hypothetical protein DSECCO2_621170 [anaerobic digester metagenome]
MHLPVGAEEVEYRSPADGVPLRLAGETRKVLSREVEPCHPLQDIGDIEIHEVPAREDVGVAFPDVCGEPPEHRGLVWVAGDLVPGVGGEFGRVARSPAGPPEERRIVLLNRVPAGDADDRVALGFGEPVFIHALDIHDAGAGGSLDIGRRDIGILDLEGALGRLDGAGGQLDAGGEAAVDHEPGGERYIGLVVLRKVVADGTDVAGAPGVEPAEGLAADGAVGRAGLDIDPL